MTLSEQWTSSKLGKEYFKGVYCYPAYLTYMQSTSGETLDWMKHRELDSPGIKIARRNINTSDVQMTPPLWQKNEEELKSPLIKVKEESEKIGSKLNIQKTKIMTHWFHQFMENRWGNNGNTDRLYFLGLQNHCRQWLQPWNLKMLAPWKKSYDQSRQHVKKTLLCWQRSV